MVRCVIWSEKYGMSNALKLEGPIEIYMALSGKGIISLSVKWAPESLAQGACGD